MGEGAGGGIIEGRAVAVFRVMRRENESHLSLPSLVTLGMLLLKPVSSTEKQESQSSCQGGAFSKP